MAVHVFVLVVVALLAALSLTSCAAGGNATPTSIAKASSTPPPTSIAKATNTPAATSALPAPTNVTLSGHLPDAKATVPAGEGEAGRVTVEWSATPGATGYRIYLRDCAGTVERVLDVDASTRSSGPLQPCRPGGSVGVSALAAGGESAITWSP